MKNLSHLLALSALFGCMPVAAHVSEIQHEPDSVYLFSYATVPDEGRSGLKLAWSPDAKKWFSVGNAYAYVKSDYGAWGAEKRMVKPHLMKGTDGLWHCVWQLNEKGNEQAHAASPDLLAWKRQTYFLKGDAQKEPSFTSIATEQAAQVEVEGAVQEGYMQKVAWEDVERVMQYADHRAYRAQLHDERTEQDAHRFANLNPVSLELTVRPQDAYPISDKLMGIFFEDINYGADGGLYAELVQNRDFEYAPSDGAPQGFKSDYAWTLAGEGGRFTIATADPIHANNPHYAVMCVQTPGVKLQNTGFDGITLKAGEKYDFSLFGRTADGTKGGKVDVLMLDAAGNTVGKASVKVSSASWKKQKAVLTASSDVVAASLALMPQAAGTYHFDLVSLFPQQTFKGQKNGLRKDLAQTLADLHPRFVRFPGGCVAHGNGIGNIYDWKGSVGPLEARKPLRNLWGYHQTRGLGYYEYFRFCEDIGAEPVPVLSAGVPCQNSACIAGKPLSGGQQGGIPMEEMDAYIQDVLDLIEYANGDPKKSPWAKMRADAGHPKPFNLKYLGIGNEDLITDVFEERFTMIYQAVREKYPEIIVIGTVGPFYEGTDYEEGWDLADRLNIPMVDEHYYNTPGWFINNQDFYDRYDRSKSKVYLGEYAAHLPNRANNIETALAEALYLTAVERNGDVVEMTSYAPLLAKDGHTQWVPDMIYFDNETVRPTVGYYVQQLYGQHAGDMYLPADRQTDSPRQDVNRRIATSVVKDSRTGDIVLKMVNLLPVSVKATVACPELPSSQATLSLLTGTPDDLTAKPTERAMEVSERFAYEMPAYSFSVIRVKAASSAR